LRTGPNWRTTLRTMQMRVSTRAAFQAVPAPSGFIVQRWRKAVNLRHMPVRARSVFEAVAARLSASPSKESALGVSRTRSDRPVPMCSATGEEHLAEAGRVERPRRVSTFTGFKPDKHATCAPLCLAESCDPASHNLAAALRLANEPGPCPVNSPLLVGRLGIAPRSLRLKGGSLSR
jgi:hypothetical protein